MCIEDKYCLEHAYNRMVTNYFNKNSRKSSVMNTLFTSVLYQLLSAAQRSQIGIESAAGEIFEKYAKNRRFFADFGRF